MDPRARHEHWRRVEALLDAALDQPREAREAYLRRSCGDDEALYDEVVQLLQAGEREDGFLARPAAALAAPLVASLQSANPAKARVGPFRLVRELGRGGMGVVYLAERDDDQFRQQVALKLVRRGLELDRRLIRRFHEERQILASLDSPHVARLVDGGLTEDGIPWFAMDYVEGEPIDRYCDARRLGVGERLALFATVCEAVEAAHRRGIVHRDLKPSNILVTRAGEPKLLDFGIAKLLAPDDDADSSAALTASGERLLTPEYASPEQIAGDAVTPASDVYSLGVMLYELLAGRRPFRRTGRSQQERYRAVLEEDPARPSLAARKEPEAPGAAESTPAQIAESRGSTPERLERRLRGDLDAIVLKAMRKEPAARYAVAADLAADIRRHLAARPVVARGDARGYRLRRFARRNRTSLTTGAAGLLAGIGLLGAAVSGGRRAAPRTAATDAGAAAAPAARTIAVLPFRNLGQPDDQYFADGLTEEMTARLAALSGLRVISRTSADQYRQTRKPLRQIGAELGAGYVLEGSVRWERGANERGRVRVTPQLIRVADDSHIWSDQYDAELTEIFRVQGEIAEQVTSALDVTLLERERAGLSAEPTSNSEAYDYYLRGYSYFNRSFSREDLGSAVEFYEKAVALDPRFAVAYARLAEAHAAMYWFYYDRTDARLELARQAAEQAVRLAPDRAEPHIALGYYYYWGHLDYPRALEHFRAARARHPNNSDLLAAIAYVEQRQGRWDDAIAKLKEAIALDPRSNVKTYQLAYAYLYVRRFDRAEEYLDRAIGLAPYWPVPYGYKALLRVVRDGDLRQARGVVHDAVARLGAGKVVPAFVVSSRVSASVITADPAFAPMIDGLSALSFDGDSVRYYLLKAEAFAFRQRRQAARVYADSARVVLEARLRAQPDDFGFRAMLGLAYAYLGRSADATREGRRATELLPVARDANLGPFMAINLARIYTMIGQPDAAVSQLEPLLSVPSWISVPELAADPVWEPLRDHPRFQRLVSRSR